MSLIKKNAQTSQSGRFSVREVFLSFVFIYPGFRQSEAGTYKYKVSACHRHP